MGGDAELDTAELNKNKKKTRDNNVSEGAENPRQIVEGKQSVL